MAKSGLPTIDGASQPPRPQPKPEPKAIEVIDAVVTEPYLPRRVDVKLPIFHRQVLAQKLRQLQDAGARLRDGAEVSDKTKVILWILENEVKV